MSVYPKPHIHGFIGRFSLLDCRLLIVADAGLDPRKAGLESIRPCGRVFVGTRTVIHRGVAFLLERVLAAFRIGFLSRLGGVCQRLNIHAQAYDSSRVAAGLEPKHESGRVVSTVGEVDVVQSILFLEEVVLGVDILRFDRLEHLDRQILGERPVEISGLKESRSIGLGDTARVLGVRV